MTSPGTIVGSAISIICVERVRGAPSGSSHQPLLWEAPWLDRWKPIGWVLDVLEVMPIIKKQIPALKTVVLNIRSNDIMHVKSVKLRDNFLQLLENAQKLAGHIIVSGPIPSRRCECLAIFGLFTSG